MRKVQSVITAGMALLVGLPSTLPASGHREAPITTLGHRSDVKDLRAFVSSGPDQPPEKVTIIMSVDPLLEPANGPGPTYFPFDDSVVYEIKIDNDHDGIENVVFQFRFSYDSSVLGKRQHYEASLVVNNVARRLTGDSGKPLYVVPATSGPRTMGLEAMYREGVFTTTDGVRVFAGTTDDPFELGASNTIAIEVPIELLTSTGRREPATSPAAAIGIWATTSRQAITVRRSQAPAANSVEPAKSGVLEIPALRLNTGVPATRRAGYPNGRRTGVTP